MIKEREVISISLKKIRTRNKRRDVHPSFNAVFTFFVYSAWRKGNGMAILLIQGPKKEPEIPRSFKVMNTQTGQSLIRSTYFIAAIMRALLLCI